MYDRQYMKKVVAVLLSAAVSLVARAQQEAPKGAAASTQEKPAAGQPSESDIMAMMMELAKPGDNHKLLAHGVGTWTYTVKAWMSPDPKAPPSESTGMTVVKEALGGRYFIGEHSGKFQMPGPDGKPMELDFKGISTEGYDNAKKMFVATWIDNMGTGIAYLMGTYDSGTKTFTYRGEEEMMPGVKTKVREVLKITDNDHHMFEWYEDRGGTEVKTMEINYTRKS
jgi:hypothetical protein